MDPAVRYARSADGTRIAYAVAGRGPLLVRMTAPGFDATGAWAWDRQLQEMADQVTLATFDCRGSGLSERQVTDLSLEAIVADLQAVIGAVATGPAGIWASVDLTPAAIRFAAEHPESVSHLVLLDPFSRSSDYTGAPFYAFDQQIQRSDWTLYLQTFVKVNMGLDGGFARGMVAMIERNVSADVWHGFARSVATWDVDDLLPSIAAPTLIVDNREPYIGAGARMAATIPNAEYHVVDDKTWSAALPLVVDFVLRDQVTFDTLRPGMSAILFLDIADSTSLTEAMGDAAFRAAARSLDEGARNAIRRAGGAPVDGKVLGDGVMAVFTSAAEAIDAARGCLELSEASGLRLHLGIHAGDVLREQGNVFGGAVNTAARICGLSEPGEILVSGTIRDLARTSANVLFEDRGEHSLKGIADPVRVYRVR